MLRRPFHTRTRSAVVPPDYLALRSASTDFIDSVIRGASDVAVVDPTLAERDRGVPASLSRAHLGTVLYIQLTPDYARAAIGMIREIGSGELVTYGYNDDPMTFAGILRRQSRANRGRHLLRALAPQLALLPPDLRDGIDKLSEYGDRIDSVDRLASVCGIARGTLWRHFRRAGITSTWGFVAGLMMLRSYDTLIDTNLRAINVAHAVGLGSERALQNRCLGISGLTLRAIQKPVPIDEFARCIAHVLTSPPSGGSRPELSESSRGLKATRAHDYSV